jgi:hypothetical protein
MTKSNNDIITHVVGRSTIIFPFIMTRYIHYVLNICAMVPFDSPTSLSHPIDHVLPTRSVVDYWEAHQLLNAIFV